LNKEVTKFKTSKTNKLVYNFEEINRNKNLPFGLGKWKIKRKLAITMCIANRAFRDKLKVLFFEQATPKQSFDV
jgi:hypothetical protein